MSFRVVILASGAGSLADALINAATQTGYPARVVALGADRLAEALNIARRHGVATFTVLPADFPDRPAWDRGLAAAVESFDPDLVVSAGFMRILGKDFLARFGERTINTHPALLPAFPGAHAVRDALAAGATVTGCTIHRVDEGVDTGPVLVQRQVAINPEDTEATLHERIKTVERELLIQTVANLATGQHRQRRPFVCGTPFATRNRGAGSAGSAGTGMTS
ncbi:MAG: phosphoribosylglycinamide formyltransferase [Bifidobacteriaceae bacterium]|nr:phosphoribosylglycinamide formyltransferase [Bifidobacteriaceae bacterium]